MDEIEIIAVYDSEDTAAAVSGSLNAWFSWVMEGDPEEVPEFFEDFGVTTEDYALDLEDTDWEAAPVARAAGMNVVISAETSETVDILQELAESLGAYEVRMAGEDDDD
ncbi:MAG: hypothetical protein GY822_22725 [Deltaproteobacteria bacterium]|nr:hypothetical protein [Deltaproteobacteria bacterium]